MKNPIRIVKCSFMFKLIAHISVTLENKIAKFRKSTKNCTADYKATMGIPMVATEHVLE